MKISYCLLLILLIQFTCSLSVAQTDHSVTGKVIAGYQGWFNAPGDGSPLDRWVHWSAGEPSPGRISFEVYPDVKDYAESSLFQTGFANLGSGQPSALFSSFRPDVTDTHFAWMAQHGIDGVAVQRFANGLVPGTTTKANRDSVAAHVKVAAEKHGRTFYIMYDISGLSTTAFASVFSDWQNTIVNNLQLTSSPNYAYEHGKPVVCLWGFGFTSRPGSAQECLAVINQFKNAGCYVIGGVPASFRTSTGDSKPGFENVYKAFHMISPWTVGRFNGTAGADNYKTNYLVPDKAYCDANNIAYQPVILPGFAWANWHDDVRNSIPRNRGEFMWRQVYNIKSTGISNAYIAMFDEYDEGTQIAKMADSYFDIPVNQYFLTSSADGTYISSDFYLRLAGKATEVIKGTAPLAEQITIPHSAGPVYFRTTFEPEYDAMPTWTSVPDNGASVVNVDAQCYTIQQNAHTGLHALRFEGTDNSASSSFAYLKVFDVNIEVAPEARLSFWTFPTGDHGRYVSVDLVMTDGSTLRSTEAVDIHGVSMKPSQGRGLVNTWNQNICAIGQWLSGKTIDRIIVGYDHAEGTGSVLTYIEDITISTGTEQGVLPGVASAAAPENNAVVPTASVALRWQAGTNATSHDIYLGESPDPVYLGNQTTTLFNSGTLKKNTTYYWRIDERNNAGVTTGPVWKFTTSPAGDEVDHTNPAGTGIIQSRPDTHGKKIGVLAFDNKVITPWIDPKGQPTVQKPSWIQIQFPAPVSVNEIVLTSAIALPMADPKNFTLKASNDGTVWTSLATWTNQTWDQRLQRKSLVFANRAAYRFYRVDITKNAGNFIITQIGEIELIGPGTPAALPGPAVNPQPADSAGSMNLATALLWRSGANTMSHDIYFGTTNPPPFKVNQLDSAFWPGTLANSTTYFWRIDERNDAGVTQGSVWSFTTVPSTNSLIDNCDVNNGWSSSNSLTVNSTDQQEGAGCIEAFGPGVNEFSKVFAPVSTISGARLQFWYYVSDVSRLTSNNQVELGSGGRPDVAEYNWSLSGLVNGWNLVSLNLSTAGVSGGAPDLKALNWFRIYRFKTDTVTVRIDDLRLIGPGESGLPGTATEPMPLNGAANVPLSTTLSWRSGYNTATHDVYFDTTNPPVFKINQTVGTYDPGLLSNSTTYFWRVNERNGKGLTIGPVWSFTTAGVPGLIDNCNAPAGWGSSNPLSVNTTDQKEGSGCLQSMGSGTNEFQKVFATINGEGFTTLQFWYFVSDVAQLGTSNQVELGSAGRADLNEYNWSLTGLVNGWNFVSLNFSSAGTTGGAPNLGALNWFRLYRSKTGAVTTRIDDIRLVNQSAAAMTVAPEAEASVFSVFPNPVGTSTNIYYVMEENAPVAIEIFDHQGIIVQRLISPESGSKDKGTHVLEFDTSNLRPGVYVLKFSNGRSTFLKRIQVRE